MKTSTTVALVCQLLLPAVALSEQLAPTPAETQIELAQRAIQLHPEHPQTHNALALAMARRARETGDPKYYALAAASLRESFRLVPANLEGERIDIWIRLGNHDFRRALEAAAALNRRIPDDVLTYGLLADANAELGNYEEAEKAAQWMLDLRPGNIAGLTRAAYLREIFGDLDGAIEFMNMAYERTQPREVEDRAWVLTQLAHLHLATGNVDLAEEALEQALVLFPDYHYALARLGELQLARGQFDLGAATLERRYELAPHPENLFAVANALQRAGRIEEAERAFYRFEELGRAEIDNVDNCNRELVSFYLDHVGNPVEALRIAELEIARRRDVHTLDAYAWALFANERYVEAGEVIGEVLKVGLRDADVLFHAGAIALERGERAVGERYLTESLELNPFSAVADKVRRLKEAKAQAAL